AVSTHIVVACDLLCEVGGHGVAHSTDAAIIDGCVAPCVVCEMRVDGDADDFNTARSKFIHAVIECNQFRWADKRKIQWIKRRQGVFVVDGIGEMKCLHNFTTAEYGGAAEIRCGFAYQYSHCTLLVWWIIN